MAGPRQVAQQAVSSTTAGTKVLLDIAVVNSSGTQIDTFGGSGTEYVVDVALGATPTGTLAIAKRDDALSALTPVESDAVELRVDANGALWTHDDALDAALAGSELQVDVVGALPTGANTIGTVNIGTFPDNEPFNVAQMNGVAVTMGNGVSGTGVQRVSIASDSTGQIAVASIAAGDNNIGNVDIVTLPASTNTLEVVGDVAHDAAAAGNPVLICGIAQDWDTTAPPNRVSTEADATRIATDRDGAVFVRQGGPQYWDYHENSSSALTDTVAEAAPGAGLSLSVTDIVVSTGAATAFNIFFEAPDATTVLGPWYLEAVAGRGFAVHFNTPKKITANTALTVTTSAAIAHSIDVTGFVAQG